MSIFVSEYIPSLFGSSLPSQSLNGILVNIFLIHRSHRQAFCFQEFVGISKRSHLLVVMFEVEVEEKVEITMFINSLKMVIAWLFTK
jgi:hypothetical protein